MKIKTYNECCKKTLSRLDDNSIDLMLTDTPYGVTQNKWDVLPDLSFMWKEWERVVKPNGAFIFTATMAFAAKLIMSNEKLFRYDLIWHKKGKSTGFLNANRMPLRSHELILVFYNKLPTYNPQKTKGRPNNSRGSHSRGKKQTNNNYGKFDQSYHSCPTNDKFPKSILEFKSVHPPIHPTQKPVDLFRWLIRTYTNKHNTVFDGYFGSGTTPIACIAEGRNFIGSELNEEYFKLADNRIKAKLAQPELIF